MGDLLSDRHAQRVYSRANHRQMTFGALRQRHAAPGAGSQRTRSRKALVIPDLSMGDLLSDRNAQRVYSRANHRQMTF